ncbi:ArsR/SmtB family transcription factor [Rhodovarius lipocyclicus]|uniref:ArsR/SmtB family transcription factor n=1 Tax=Rhodovarius lipocyclicus TaxID=268410 RepID=UPI0013579DE9|nr:metalloregulator ArsR/SmtB family transcription factor [Rhodovarius lipocyclicus]
MSSLDALLAALSHPARRQALRLLEWRAELCLCEVMAHLRTGQSTMSRHMATLKEVGLVLDRRDAQWVRYRLNPAVPADLGQVVRAVLDAEPAARQHDERSAA